MAGLQRFITYINKYEDDEKQDNAGFAKIEIRGTKCRVEVHIRSVSTEQTEATVYLFAQKDEIMQGIPVGSMEIIRGGSDVRYVFDTKEMQDFGMTMDEMQGIFIPLDEHVFLASRWKEGTVSGKNFKILKKQEQIQTGNASEPEAEHVPSPAAVNTPQQSEEQPHSDHIVSAGELEEQAASGADDGQTEPEAFGQPKEEFDSDAKEAAPKIPQVQAQEKRNIRATEIPLEKFREETGLERIFAKFRLKSGVCFPFEGQETECIRMNLNDLREFPQKYWYLGKNSFLLHGFFNYRHILLGETEERGKKEYFLGIPGVFQNQERLMASMFGFPGFRTAKAAEYKTGNFGYWYRII